MPLANRTKLIERIRTLATPLSPLSSNQPTRLARLDGIRCVAFDFYGTMFMSGVGDIGIDEEQNEQSEALFVESLKQAGFEILNPGAGSEGIKILKATLGRHITAAQKKGIAYPEPEIRDVWEETLSALQKKSLVNGTVDDRSVARFAIEFEFRINAIWPVPELEETLGKLLNRNLLLGIISNSQFYTPLAFEAIIGQSPQDFGFDPGLLVWSFATGRKKPDTGFYQTFVDRLPKKSLKARQVLYVGNDIRKDIKPAKALGMRTALYVGDSRSIRHKPEELNIESYNPDLIIDSLDQIVHCLD